MRKTAKAYRVKGDLAQKAHNKMIDYITRRKENISEAEIINACIYKGMKDLKDSEIKMYLELVEQNKIN